MKCLITTLMLLALAGSLDASNKKARGRAAWALAAAAQVKVSTSIESLNFTSPTTQGTLYYAPIQRPYTSQPCTTGT